MKYAGIVLVAALCGGACGTSGKSPDGNGGDAGAGGGKGSCRANSPLGASVSWREDGAAKCAVSVVAQRATDGAGESLQLQGVTLDGASVAFAVIAYGVGSPLEGSHDCSVVGGDGGLLGTPGTYYVDFVHPGTKQTCNVVITNGGMVGGASATGTFTATFTGAGGAVVTSGVFDTPVKGPPTGAKM